MWQVNQTPSCSQRPSEELPKRRLSGQTRALDFKLGTCFLQWICICSAGRLRLNTGTTSWIQIANSSPTAERQPPAFYEGPICIAGLAKTLLQCLQWNRSTRTVFERPLLKTLFKLYVNHLMKGQSLLYSYFLVSLCSPSYDWRPGSFASLSCLPPVAWDPAKS